MNAPPFPSNPQVGEFFGNWVWNGVRWVCSPAAGVRVVQTVMSVSGPYMPSPGLVSVAVECLGGGGGGGAALGSATATVAGWMVGGGGGAGGNYARSVLAAAMVLGGVNVVCGAPGQGGQASPEVQPTAGGDTTFGAMILAHGGGAGGNTVLPGDADGHGGIPAEIGMGDLDVPGNTGHAGGGTLSDPGVSGGGIWGGAGGAGHYGGAGLGGYASTGGAQLPLQGWWGGGGGGAASGAVTQAVNGQNGGGGIVVLTEYCWADSASDDCLNPPVNVNARVAVTHVPWQGPGPCPPGWGGQLDYDE